MNQDEYKMSRGDIIACVGCVVWIVGVLAVVVKFAPWLLSV